MTDLTMLGWTAAVVALVVFVGWILRLVGRYSKQRLMRCPETGSVAFVRVEQDSRPDGKLADLAICECDLWPEKKDCARGCLARYDETAPGFRINVRALRPFEQP